MNYKKHREEFQEKVNNFPLIWAFSEKQLLEGMEKMGWKDKSELCSIEAGGVIKKSDLAEWKKLLKDDYDEIKNYLKTDDEYLESAIRYHIINEECCYTGNFDVVIETLGISMKDEREKRIFLKVKSELAKKQED